MRTVRVRRMFQYFIIGLMVVMGTSGCFKADVSVELKANGSGVLGVAVGMTQQAKSLFSSQGGGDPFQSLQDQLSQQDGQKIKDVNVTKWVDGDYEWMKAERPFRNLEEVNALMGRNQMFNRFSLTRNRGVLQDEYVLDAELNKINDKVPGGEGLNLNIDPATFIGIKFSALLPGKIVESNGFADAENPNLLSWTAQGNQNVPIQARVRVWNRLVVLVLVLVIGLIVVMGIAVVVLLVVKGSRKKQPDQGNETNLPTA
jgi:hypothetical protein